MCFPEADVKPWPGQGGARNTLLTTHQDECTYCHKLDSSY